MGFSNALWHRVHNLKCSECGSYHTCRIRVTPHGKLIAFLLGVPLGVIAFFLYFGGVGALLGRLENAPRWVGIIMLIAGVAVDRLSRWMGIGTHLVTCNECGTHYVTDGFLNALLRHGGLIR